MRSGLPNATNLGNAFGAVVDTSAPVDLYIKLSQQRKAEDEFDRQATSGIISQLSSEQGRLRAPDREEYRKMYDEYKNILIQNPDIYRNPLKKQELFNRAELLKTQMSELANDSKTQAANTLELLKLKAKEENKHKFRRGSINLFADAAALPTKAFKDKYGDFANLGMVQYIPEAPDPDKLGKSLDLHTKMYGGAKDVPFYETNKENKNIKVGDVYHRIDRVYSPQQVSDFAQLKYQQDPEWFDYTVAEDPEYVQQQQAELNKKMGDSAFQIKDGNSLARAYAINNFDRRQGEGSIKRDEAYWDKINYNQQVALKNMNKGDGDNKGNDINISSIIKGYPVVNGKRNLTEMFAGLSIGKQDNEEIPIKDVLFDEDEKTISYNGKPPVSVEKFIADMNTLNPLKDLKYAKALISYKKKKGILD